MKFDANARLAARPTLSYDEALPVNQKRAEIAEAIRKHQVVVVCGETGSGKTTQLPKICLELGRGAHGLIGHTQPRRIAARATATRIAQELKSEIGQYVGYKIRFTDKTSASSYIKLMTDGILLAETQGDPLLRQYDTIIIDEAHERSLNIDFLLGYLRGVLQQRPELKLIVTSATLDAERFSRHFTIDGKAAPVIEVSGRLYPIETRYRPFGIDDDRDISEAIVDAVDEAHRSGPGDVLVFLPGEREIREAAEALRKHHPAGTEILPLFARQSAQEQGRVFQSHQGRRVVLATNVAETSLTVPGIRYVVDTGLARVKRYSHRNKVDQLLVEPIAQSAAKQRAGRCGRVASGICIRLYDEDDFNKRLPHTEPEILRSSLAGVILRMKALHLGDVEDFPFLEAPLPRMIADGYQLLAELGAIDEESKQLTKIGEELARLPLDPKIGRMILAARQQNCLREVLIIAAALSAQDPRERPQEQAGSADQAHAKWKDEKSEFLFWLKLWNAADEVWKHESQSKQRQWCKSNFLSWLRMREWRDVHAQLHVLCAEHGWKETSAYGYLPSPSPPAGEGVRKREGEGGRSTSKPPLSSALPHEGAGSRALDYHGPGYDAIHKALLTGLLGHIGLKSEEAPHYLGARGIKFFIHPGSTLQKKAGKWIVSGELVDTSRLFARTVAKIEPEWLEQVGAHLVRKHAYEPHWEKNSGQVVAFERATLHGILLYAKRRINYGPRDPKLARELFIRGALVNGQVHEDYVKRARFLQHNQKLVREIEALEHKSRRPDVLVDEELIYAFYDSKLPADATTLAAFDRWRKDAEQKAPRLLFLEKEQLMRHEAAGITTDAFPPHFDVHGQKLKLAYHHDPGAADDGVTLSLPLALLNQLPANRVEWLVPGLLKEKVVALLKTLPQKFRHRLQPLEGFAEAFCDEVAQSQDAAEPLVRALTRAAEEKLAMKLPLDAFRTGELRPHLFMNFRLLDEHGGTLTMSRSLPELRTQFAERVEQSFAQAEVRVSGEGDEGGKSGKGGKGNEGELSGLTSWSFGDLPELLEVRVNGRDVLGFPALVDEGDSVSLRAIDNEDKARALHRAGLARLFALSLKEQVKFIDKSLPGLRDMAMQFMLMDKNGGTEQELKQQIQTVTLARSCLMVPLPTTQSAFEARRDSARGRITLIAQEVARLIGTILTEHAALTKKLSGMQKAFPAACTDIQAQLAALLGKGFIVKTDYERLQHYPRYLKAAAMRLDKLRADPARDARQLAEWQAVAKPFEREWLNQQKSGVHDPALEEFRWLLEELRVALFAQELRTPSPVSVKRLQKMWNSRPRH